MYTIKISKLLRKYCNNLEVVQVDADSYRDLYFNLSNLFPDLKRFELENINNKTADIWFLVDGEVLPREEFLLAPSKSRDLVLVPLIRGSGDDIGGIIIGVIIIAVSIVAMQPEFAIGMGIALAGEGGLTAALGVAGMITSLAEFGLSVGLGMVLSGMMNIISPKKQASQNSGQDSTVRANNDMFGALQNTTSTEDAVPLIFGLTRVPGQFIGGRVRTITHNAGDYISVANYI